MKVNEGTWDVRCPEELSKLFRKRSGYYFRVDHDTARKVLSILSEAYEIPAPKVGKIPNGSEEHALYEYDTQTVLLYPRNHLRSVFHEFYHHLDNMTDGAFDSDDHDGGSSSFAWMFADRLWAKFSDRTADASQKGSAT
jgi:hypothetical protein